LATLTGVTGWAIQTGRVQALINEIYWMFSDAVMAIQELGAKLLASIVDVYNAVRAAVLQAAAATSRLTWDIMRLSIFPVVKSLGPHVFNNDVQALAGEPSWFVLRYMADPIRAAQHRRAAIKRGWILLNPALGLNSLDEFPYASTVQGGAAARVAAVPAWENSLQGGFLGAFYRWRMRGIPGEFLVVPIDI
jgi:hypothetical protein